MLCGAGAICKSSGALRCARFPKKQKHAKKKKVRLKESAVLGCHPNRPNTGVRQSIDQVTRAGIAREILQTSRNSAAPAPALIID